MRYLAIVTLLLIAACTEVDPDTTTAQKPPCDEWGCGNNGSNMGSHNFHDVLPGGLVANSAGLYLDGLWQGGLEYRPTVTRDRLTGVRAGSPTLEYGALTGAYLRLHDAAGDEWRIYIESVSRSLTFWQFPLDGRIETYRLRYISPGMPAPPMGVTRGLCNNPPVSNLDENGADVGPLDEAFLFTGDRYDAASKTVTAGDPATAGAWINIACAGSVLAKMHLLGYTWAAGTAAHSTTLAQRNDLLAMYTGNVCGNGVSYTVTGTPITWKGSNGWIPPPWSAAAATHEVIWNHGRAVCLDTWRIGTIIIPCAGALPTCAGYLPAWETHGTITSGLP